MKLQFLKFTLLFTVLFFAAPANAQSNATFDAGQVFSSFKYTDAQGVQEKGFSNNISGCFSLGYQYVQNNGLFFRANIGMRKAGASMIFNETNVTWNLQYADANLGLGYMINKWRLKPYLSVSPYFGYMLKANQAVGPDTYDIMQNKSIKTTDYGLFFSPGLKIALSNIISFYAEYKYIMGLQNLEKSNQKSYNRGFSINLGISVAIIKYNYVTSK